ncbi:hypothetical protein [Isoptericola sp. b408]|uniref:hypothetical protein n=1 Tax=Isoptericola sp. b408 TaxID=3064653 RepID=UPI0027128C82|nr:hypothetical protein [Isoptericola sp. b408]MDO8151776.1 hypothetical protein [Isoptericola sp. b408]
MSRMVSRVSRTLLAVLLVGASAQVAAAAEGESTPGVTMTAVNPASALRDGGLRIALTAHSGTDGDGVTSCRPQDATIDCWGSLVLQTPGSDGLRLADLEVHRVMVGGEGGGHGPGGGHGGGHDGHDGHLAFPDAVVDGAGQQAVVSGQAVLRDPGSTGLPRGSAVQVRIHLTDVSQVAGHDLVDVQVNELVHGPVKPVLYESGPQPVQQVGIHPQG